MSYELGRYEGWIALKRNRLALAIFPSLPGDLAELAVSEFVALVRSGLYAEAADIVAGPGKMLRGALFSRLKDLSDSQRREFAKVLYVADLSDVPIPGYAPPPPRPWRR
jgi:hypothetical protein